MPLPNNIASATITLYKINEVSIYKSELISSNGTIFHPYDLETTLTFTIFKESQDITKEFTDIVWTRYSYDSDQFLEDENWGKEYTGLKTITIHKDDFQEKCVIQVDAYTVLNGKRTCVASSRITLLDINELYSSETPPENPKDGQMWVDTSGLTPIIHSWNNTLKKWIKVGPTVAVVRNLIRNSNFWKLNSDYFHMENDSFLRNLTVVNTFEKNWLRLKSSKATNSEFTTAGVYQATEYPIIINSDYTFSFLAYRVKDIENVGENIYIKILSINSQNESTELGTFLEPILDTTYKRVNCTVKTLNDTVSIKVIIGVEPTKMCEFYITELSLYNTDKIYPWELAPEDAQEQLDTKLDNDQMSVFNALTKNGTMEGIYMSVDENGDEHYYFNASHIKTGSIDGGLINGIGLNIKDEATGQSIFHVYKDEYGTHIDMIAQNLYIGTEPASTQQYAIAQAAQAETNAAGYTDSTVKTNREESELLLNGNIAASAQTVTTEMTAYVDAQIDGALTTGNGYADGIVGDSVAALTKLIDNKTSDAVKSANKYTDDSIDDLSKSINQTFSDVDKDIEDAIKDSKDYSDGLDKVLREDLSQHEKDTQKYIEDQIKAVTNVVNSKADAETVSALSGTVSTIQNQVLPASIVSTVRTSTEYTNDLKAKLSTSDFTTYRNSMADTIKAINDTIEANKNTWDSEFDTLNKTIVKDSNIISKINDSLETEKISASKIDVAEINGTVDKPKDEIYTKTIYSKNKILFVPNQTVDVTIDNLLSNIDFDISGTDIEMNVTKIGNTNYVKTSTDKSEVYIDMHEMIKYLLYKVKQLEQKIN